MIFNCDRQSYHLISSISVLAITTSLVAGQSASEKSLAQTSTTPPPAGVLSINGAGASTLNTLFVGSGTTAPFSPQNSWFNFYGVGNPPSLNNPAGATNGPVNSAVTFRYASVGSGAGITAFFSQTVPPASPGPTILPPVSFAASDDPLAGTQVEQVVTTGSGRPNSGKAIQVPVVGVGITLSYNSTGLTIPAAGLRLSRNTYCGILNGSITNWNDSRIRTDNGGTAIAANLPIRVVRRSDSSGSTFVLSTHLNTACKTAATPGLQTTSVWNRGVGSISSSGTVPPTPPANTVVWPASFLSASGGGAVATTISTTSGAIGYVDSATRLARSLPAALLRNRAGTYVGPTTAGIQGALSGGTVVTYGAAPANRLVRIDNLADPTPSTAYPISTASYLLFYDRYANTTIAANIRAFINWALGGTPASTPTADSIAIARGYAPLPAAIKTQSRNVVNTFVNTTSP